MQEEKTNSEDQPKSFYNPDDINIISGHLFRGDYEIIFQTHALIQAMRRAISTDTLRSTVFHGEFKRFGANKVKIIKRFREGKVILVGVIENNEIRILTVEIGK